MKESIAGLLCAGEILAQVRILDMTAAEIPWRDPKTEKVVPIQTLTAVLSSGKLGVVTARILVPKGAAAQEYFEEHYPWVECGSMAIAAITHLDIGSYREREVIKIRDLWPLEDGAIAVHRG